MRREKGFRHPRYEVTKLLAEGGMGKVFLAKDLLEDDREVALKVYPATYYHARLKEEFLALKSLSHPGVARALHFGVSDGDGAPFFTLELIRGKPLHAFVGTLPADARLTAAARLLVKATRAVAYLHRRRVLHLDLKPDNILVLGSESGLPPRPVLIDFGLVRLAGDTHAPVGHATLPYAPPESFTGTVPTPASDVYSLAAAFYKVFSGRYPVIAGSPQAFAKAHRSRGAAPLPEVPQPLERILLRALAKDPSKRFRDAGEMLAALLKLDKESLLGAGAEPGEILFHEPELVGRAAELAAFQAWLDKRLQGLPALEILGGSGFGKSRFLERVETLLETRGSPAVALRTTAETGWPLLSKLERAAEVLANRRSRAQPRPIDSVEKARRISREVLSAMLPLLREGLFVLIDDLHLASPLEEGLLADLARALSADRQAKGGIVVSRAKGPEPETPWAKSGFAASVSLSPLEIGEALEIDLEGLDGAFSGLSPERIKTLKQRLFEETGGHPLFFVRGLIDLAGGGPEAAQLAPTERLAGQVRRLSDEEQTAALTLSLLAREASPTEVSRLAGLETGVVRAALERLRWRGLVTPRGAGFRIVHDSIAQALKATRRHEEIAELHAGIATRLREAGPPGGSPGSSLEAAWHFLEAGNRERGIDCALEWAMTAESCAENVSPRGAETLLRAASSAGDSTPSGKVLLEAASDALESLGRFAECAQARERLVSDTKNGAAPSPVDVRRLRKLGSVCHRAGFIDRAVLYLSSCVTPEAESASPVESLRAHADLALIHHFRGETDQALAHAKHGSDVWRRSSSLERDATVQSAVNFLVVEGQVRIRRLEIDDARRVLEDGLKLTRKAASPANTALLLNNLALAQHLAGKLDQALATFAKAEAMARDLHDAAALVSIRSNVVQILARKGRFRAARAILDEVEESLAAQQSRRLRLYCLYTRGLFLSLLGADSSELWSAVDSQARESNDAFLSRFARLYLAESQMATGRYSEAKETLKRLDAEPAALPSIAAPVLARRSLAEAMVGRLEAARAARARLDIEPEGPPLLSAWNQLQAGCSAMETRDFDEAESRLEKCRGVFHGTGAVVGEVECALVLADLWLRKAGVSGEPGASLDRAAAEIALSRKLKLESPGDASPRLRELRASILEARVSVARWWDGFTPATAGKRGKGSQKSMEKAGGTWELMDWLARSSGDPSLAGAPDLRIVLECVNAAAARLEGNAEAARAAADRVRKLQTMAAESSSPADRAGVASSNLWVRFGLQAFEPPSGECEMQPRHAQALGRILRELEIATGEHGSVLTILGEIASALNAERMAFVPALRGRVEWHDASGSSSAAGPEASRIWAPCRFQGHEAGILIAYARNGDCFQGSDLAFLHAAAFALAPRLVRPRTIPDVALSSKSSSRTSELGIEARIAGPGGTQPISRTRRVSDTSLKSGSIARTLKEEGFIASGRETLKALRVAAAMAVTEMPVLITGDSGTGKNALARVIHRLSRRAQSPFLVQSSNAVPPELFEADFFGYESGAFTGAERTRTGFLFQADGGTFHLEEVGDLEPTLQQRLLRVIEERSVRPLGATDSRSLDVRFIVSTQRDLKAMVSRGEFRKDLYYRLTGAQVRLPPLTERMDDLEPLIEHHWRLLTGSRAPFPRSAIDLLRRHDWPGNVRELVSVLRRLCLESKSAPTTDDVRAALGSKSERPAFPAELFESTGYDEVSRLLERSYLEHLLKKHSGSLDAIASALGTTTRSIYRRFERLGLKPKDFAEER